MSKNWKQHENFILGNQNFLIFCYILNYRITEQNCWTAQFVHCVFWFEGATY